MPSHHHHSCRNCHQHHGHDCLHCIGHHRHHRRRGSSSSSSSPWPLIVVTIVMVLVAIMAIIIGPSSCCVLLLFQVICSVASSNSWTVLHARSCRNDCVLTDYIIPRHCWLSLVCCRKTQTSNIESNQICCKTSHLRSQSYGTYCGQILRYIPWQPDSL